MISHKDTLLGGIAVDKHPYGSVLTARTCVCKGITKGFSHNIALLSALPLGCGAPSQEPVPKINFTGLRRSSWYLVLRSRGVRASRPLSRSFTPSDVHATRLRNCQNSLQLASLPFRMCFPYARMVPALCGKDVIVPAARSFGRRPSFGLSTKR